MSVSCQWNELDWEEDVLWPKSRCGGTTCSHRTVEQKSQQQTKKTRR